MKNNTDKTPKRNQVAAKEYYKNLSTEEIKSARKRLEEAYRFPKR